MSLEPSGGSHDRGLERLLLLLKSSYSSDGEGSIGDRGGLKLLKGHSKQTNFTSAFNLGGSRLQVEDIAAWLHLNFDLYASVVKGSMGFAKPRDSIIRRLC